MSDLTTIATGILPASGVKAGTVYGIVPTNDNTTGIPKTAFDFTFTRNGPAYRTNENGVLEEMANDVCRVDYSGGGCPSLLLEPSRTNLFLNSDVGVSQIIAGLSIGVEYTLTFYEGDGNIDISSTPGDPVYVGVPFTFTTASNNYNFTVTGTCNKVQLELGGYATSYIKTEGTTVTRPSEDVTLSGLQTNGILGVNEGTFYFDYSQYKDSDASYSSLMRIYSDTQNYITFVARPGFDNRLRVSQLLAGSTVADYTRIGASNYSKWAVRWNGTNFDIFIDGANLYTDSTAGANSYTDFRIFNTSKTLFEFGKLLMFKTALTDEEMIQLTS